jgi:hypothetical protein
MGPERRTPPYLDLNIEYSVGSSLRIEPYSFLSGVSDPFCCTTCLETSGNLMPLEDT